MFSPDAILACMSGSLHGSLARAAEEQHGIFTRAQIRAAGFDDKDIQRLAARAVWCRVRRGVFAEAAHWVSLSFADRHRLEIRAALCRLAKPAVASHWSAGVVYEWPLLHAQPEIVRLTRTDLHSARTEAGIQHHAGQLDLSATREVDGIPVTSSARTVVDIARHSSFAAGVVVADRACTSARIRRPSAPS